MCFWRKKNFLTHSRTLLRFQTFTLQSEGRRDVSPRTSRGSATSQLRVASPSRIVRPRGTCFPRFLARRWRQREIQFSGRKQAEIARRDGFTSGCNPRHGGKGGGGGERERERDSIARANEEYPGSRTCRDDLVCDECVPREFDSPRAGMDGWNPSRLFTFVSSPVVE